MKSVLHSFSYCLDYLDEQLDDVDNKDMVAQPNGIRNHPAWVVGHLAFSCQALGSEIGLESWLPKHWQSTFGTGSKPVADTRQYDGKSDLLRMLSESRQRIESAVERLTAIQLDQPLPDECARALLPTVRHAITHILIAHPANHIGQITLWRRAMGLPSITRPFL